MKIFVLATGNSRRVKIRVSSGNLRGTQENRGDVRKVGQALKDLLASKRGNEWISVCTTHFTDEKNHCRWQWRDPIVCVCPVKLGFTCEGGHVNKRRAYVSLILSLKTAQDV